MIRKTFLFSALLFLGCSEKQPEPMAKQPVVQKQTSAIVAKQTPPATASQTKVDELLSSLAKAFINMYFESNGFGSVEHFSINTKNKRIDLTAKLKGEVTLLGVTIHKYEIIKTQNKNYFVAKEVATTKEWLNAAAKTFLKEKRVEIPKEYELLVTIL